MSASSKSDDGEAEVIGDSGNIDEEEDEEEDEDSDEYLRICPFRN